MGESYTKISNDIKVIQNYQFFPKKKIKKYNLKNITQLLNMIIIHIYIIDIYIYIYIYI